jgi:hypothetical protein
MEVSTARGAVGVLHGEVPRGMAWGEFLAGIEDGDKNVMESCLRGRARLKHADARGVPGVGRIFAGHLSCCLHTEGHSTVTLFARLHVLSTYIDLGERRNVGDSRTRASATMGFVGQKSLDRYG